MTKNISELEAKLKWLKARLERRMRRKPPVMQGAERSSINKGGTGCAVISLDQVRSSRK